MEHLSQEQCAAYRDRTLGPGDLLAVDAHIAGCEDCRNRLRVGGLTGPTAPIVSRLGITHLTYEEMEAYVDQEGSEAIRSHVESHSRRCPNCLRELNDLIEFRRKLNRDPATNRQGTVSQHRSFFPWKFSYLAAAAAALLLVSAGIWWRSLAPGRQQGLTLAAVNDAGGQLQFTPTGRLTTGGWTSAERAIIEDAWREKALQVPPRMSALRGKSGTQRSLDDVTGFDVFYPVGLAVLSTRPAFVWKPLKGASYYVVEIFDSNFHQVARSGRLTLTEWIPVHPLESGTVYSWQVTALAGAKTLIAPGAKDPEARFQILSAAEAGELERVSSQHPNAHLLLGALYARAGVLDRAKAQISALAAANPESAEVRGLLESASAALHQKE